EFDQRNLNKFFFPGLVFEFQFLQGARLVGVNPEQFQTKNDLQQADITGELYLYYVYGTFGTSPVPRLAELHRTDGGSDGYEVLRTIRDLEPGPLMVVVGPKDPLQLGSLSPQDGLMFYGMIQERTKRIESPEPTILRDPDGKLLAAIFVGDRARY